MVDKKHSAAYKKRRHGCGAKVVAMAMQTRNDIVRCKHIYVLCTSWRTCADLLRRDATFECDGNKPA